LRNGAGRLVELPDQRLDQLHAVGRGRNQQRVGARVGRDPHVGEYARAEFSLSLGIDGHESQHGGLFGGCLSGWCCRGARHGGDCTHLTGDRRHEHVGHFIGKGVLQGDHPQFVDCLAGGGVDLLDQRSHFDHIARAGLHEKRVRAIVGHCPYPCAQPILHHKKVLHRRLYCGGGGMFQAEHLELRVGGDGLVELAHQIDHQLHVFATAYQQQGIRLDQGGDAHVAAAGEEDFVVQRPYQVGNRDRVDVTQLIDFDGRLGFCRQTLDLLDDLLHALHVALMPADHQHVQPFEQLHLHRSDHSGPFLAGPGGLTRSGLPRHRRRRFAGGRRWGRRIGANLSRNIAHRGCGSFPRWLPSCDLGCRRRLQTIAGLLEKRSDHRSAHYLHSIAGLNRLYDPTCSCRRSLPQRYQSQALFAGRLGNINGLYQSRTGLDVRRRPLQSNAARLRMQLDANAAVAR